MSTGELPDAETFLYELTFNAGLIGALKGSGKVIKKANEFIREKAPSMRKSNLLDATLESDAFSSLDNNIKKQIKDGLIGADEGAEISKAISEVREVNKNSLKEKSIGLNGIIDFIDNVIPNILKSKRADKDTAKTLRDVKIGINAQKEAIEMIRDKRKSELGNAERQSLDRIIKEAEENLRLLDDIEAKIDEGIYVQGKASKAVERTVPLGRKKIIDIANKYGLDLEDLFDSPKPKPGDVILTESLFKNKKKWTKEEKLIAFVALFVLFLCLSE